MDQEQITKYLDNLREVNAHKEELRAELRKRLVETQEALDSLGEPPKPKRGRRPKAKPVEVK